VPAAVAARLLPRLATAAVPRPLAVSAVAAVAAAAAVAASEH
jgi:hypothetical protein